MAWPAPRSARQPLRAAMSLNGAVFLVRGSLNLRDPHSFYLEPGAPPYAKDAVRVLGITYVTLGLCQLVVANTSDRRTLHGVAGASLGFAAGLAVQGLVQQRGTLDRYHVLSRTSAAENAVVGVVYALLIARDRQRCREMPQ